MNARLLVILAALAAPSQAPAQSPAPAKAPGAAPALPAGTEPYGPQAMVAKEDSVPVRTDPGFVYREIRFLKKGDQVTVDARNGAWLHAVPAGWILAEHLLEPGQEPVPEPRAMLAIREGVRVRKSPSTDAEVTRTLADAEAVAVVGEEAGWWKLDDGGYVAKALLRPDEPEPDHAGAAAAPWTVKGPTANVRSDRTTSASVVRRLGEGDAVTVSEVVDGWARVADGWVRADMLVAPEAPPPGATRRPPTDLPRPSDAVGRRWSLVDLTGVIFEVIDLSGSPLVPAIKREMRDTGVLEEDWTFLGLTIGVPEDSPYRFNFSPDKNNTIVTDIEGQNYGNIYVRGPFDRLPAHVRQFFLPMTVKQGEKFDGILIFRPTLDPRNIKEISIFIGGRMQKMYESTP